jgi:hypothetical protein
VGFVSFGERERGEMGSQLMRRVNFSSQKKKVMKRGGFRPAYAGRFDGRKVRFRFHMSCGPSDPTVDGCDEVCTYQGISCHAKPLLLCHGCRSVRRSNMVYICDDEQA